MKLKNLVQLSIFLFLIINYLGCNGSSVSNKNNQLDPSPLTLEDTLEVQLMNEVNTSYTTTVYDIDLFDTNLSVIQYLQSKNIKVICYFSAGSYEDWREDANSFPEEGLGNELDGWVGENWLDIRNPEIRNMMANRIKFAYEKGCDGIDPDNVDGYTNNTGFPLSYQDQLNYNKFLSNTAKQYGLLIGLKNDLNQINDLIDYFDFSINEQCHIYSECDLLTPFILKSKPVFNIEYDNKYVNNTNNDRDLLCADSQSLGLYTIVMPHLLDGSFRLACD